MTFGGTSGAGPHVAAAVALLAEYNPDWDAEEIQQILFDAAKAEGLSPDGGTLPNRHWGEGKVDVFKALKDERPPEPAEQPPEAQLRVYTDVQDDEMVFTAASSTLEDDEEQLQYRFDLDYDGDWDTEWLDEPVLRADVDDFELGGEYTARVQVRDSTGASAGALQSYTAPANFVGGYADGEGAMYAPEVAAAEQGGCGCSATGEGLPGQLVVVAAALLGLLALRHRDTVSVRIRMGS